MLSGIVLVKCCLVTVACCVNISIVVSALCVGDDIEHFCFPFCLSSICLLRRMRGAAFRENVLRGNSIQAKATLGFSLVECPL